MPAQYPLVMAGFKQVLVAGVTLVSGRVFLLPWEDQPEVEEVGSYLAIEVLESDIDSSEAFGRWRHPVPVRIGAVVSGKFDHPGTWEILNQASQTLTADYTLGGLVQQVKLTGKGEVVEFGGTKYHFPHLKAEIIYLTPEGSL